MDRTELDIELFGYSSDTVPLNFQELPKLSSQTSVTTNFTESFAGSKPIHS
ncbi:hypothetical protein H4Q26_003396 [Puccinia striiformis f. sp. tritici PST-130]|nr:hypothetical protein H4Q26_003396 [Puccinia striiformis f. sp. tritici PST-130]